MLSLSLRSFHRSTLAVAVAALTLTTPGNLVAPAHAGEPQCCMADFWCHGFVDIFDLLFVLQDWGLTTYPWADFNQDGIVDGQDVGYLLAHWGPCSQDLPQPVEGEMYLWAVDVTSSEIAAMGKRVWDVYLNFNDPDTLLINVFDVNISCQGGMAPCFFHGDPFGEGDTQMFPFPQFFWDEGWVSYDSFVTVGLRYADDNQAEGDPNLFASDFLKGSELGGAGSGAGWFSLPPEAQGKASDYPRNRVLIASFTVPSNAVLLGEISAMYQEPSGELFSSSVEVKLTKIADLNFDGVVNVSDLLILLSSWGPCDPKSDCPANLSGDGVVNVTDLLILLSNWG